MNKLPEYILLEMYKERTNLFQKTRSNPANFT